MDHRRLGFLAMGASLSALFGLIPLMGAAMSLVISLSIWAVLDFKWFLLSFVVGLPATLLSFIQGSAMGAAVGQMVEQMAAQNPTFVPYVSLEIAVFYGAAFSYLWWFKNGLRRAIVRRIGASRLP